MATKSGIRWVWTLYLSKAPKGLTFDRKDDNLQYLVCQVERCPETKKLHYQGYVEFKKNMKRDAVKKWFRNKTVHVEWARYREEAKNYCFKEESKEPGYDRVEIGEWIEQAGQGTRTDLKKVAEEIKEKGWVKTALNHPDVYMKYSKNFLRLDELYRSQRTWQLEIKQPIVHVDWGMSGHGKSYIAHVAGTVRPAFRLSQSQRGSATWFDGYVNQPILILEDFDGWIPYREFLALLDGYHQPVQTKGGMVDKGWDTIYINSNKHPKYWYPSESYIQPMLRRLDHIRCHGAWGSYNLDCPCGPVCIHYMDDEVAGNTSAATSEIKDVVKRAFK